MNWNKYSKAFEIFADTTATVAQKGNYDDYANTYEVEELETITGDLQGYSSTLAHEEYGLSIDCEGKFYCKDTIAKEGMYLIIGTSSYRIEKIRRARMGLMLFLKEASL